MQVQVVLPFGIVGLHDGLFAARPGVVDEDVRPAERVQNRLGKARHVVCAAHVGPETERLDAVRRSHPGRLALRPRPVPTAERDLNPFLRQALGDRQTDADAAPGNNRDLPAES